MYQQVQNKTKGEGHQITNNQNVNKQITTTHKQTKEMNEHTKQTTNDQSTNK